MKEEVMSLLRRCYNFYIISYKSPTEWGKVNGNQDYCIIGFDACTYGLDEGFDQSNVGLEKRRKKTNLENMVTCLMTNKLDLYLMEKIDNPKPIIWVPRMMF